MPVRKSKGVHRNDFDVSVDEGTFGDYEVFGVHGGHGKDKSSEYEIFIVQTPNQGFRSSGIRRLAGPCRGRSRCILLHQLGDQARLGLSGVLAAGIRGKAVVGDRGGLGRLDPQAFLVDPSKNEVRIRESSLGLFGVDVRASMDRVPFGVLALKDALEIALGKEGCDRP